MHWDTTVRGASLVGLTQWQEAGQLLITFCAECQEGKAQDTVIADPKVTKFSLGYQEALLKRDDVLIKT